MWKVFRSKYLRIQILLSTQSVCLMIAIMSIMRTERSKILIIKITKITIQRFRSIIDMSLKFNTDNNIVSICGQNNVGKTNTLRALSLFFNPEQYNPKTDIPTLKNATWGGAVHPKIIVEFWDESTKQRYVLTRDFKNLTKDSIELSGYLLEEGH